MGLLTEKEKRKLDRCRKVLAEGGSPFEHLSRLRDRFVNLTLPLRRSSEMSHKDRLNKWLNSDKCSGKIVKRVKIDGGYAGLECMICNAPIDFLSSIPGKVRRSTGFKRMITSSPHLLCGELLEVEEMRILSFPVMKTGRACKDCSYLLDEVIHEKPDYGRESVNPRYYPGE